MRSIRFGPPRITVNPAKYNSAEPPIDGGLRPLSASADTRFEPKIAVSIAIADCCDSELHVKRLLIDPPTDAVADKVPAQ
jgi:hypothetical protein